MISMFLAVIRYYTAPVIITTVYHFITFEVPYPTWSNTVAFELWLRVVKVSGFRKWPFSLKTITLGGVNDIYLKMIPDFPLNQRISFQFLCNLLFCA